MLVGKNGQILTEEEKEALRLGKLVLGAIGNSPVTNSGYRPTMDGVASLKPAMFG